MTHAIGKVRFDDGLVMFLDYSHTADVASSDLFDTLDEAAANMRGDNFTRSCDCGDDETVELVEFPDAVWPGRDAKACRACKCLTDDESWGRV